MLSSISHPLTILFISSFLHRRCNLPSGLSSKREVGPSSQLRSRLMLDPKRDRVRAVTIRLFASSLYSGIVTSLDRGRCSAWSSLLSRRLLLASRAMRIVERIVDLSGNPQTVQKHRELPRHGHRCPLLGVLLAPREAIFSSCGVLGPSRSRTDLGGSGRCLPRAG
jgi:hypothetical protein